MFRNREEAGRMLAGELSRYRNDPTALILALPRGGVAVGYQLSLALHLPLDVFMTRKIGAPGNPEYAIGAVADGNHSHQTARLQTANGKRRGYERRACGDAVVDQEHGTARELGEGPSLPVEVLASGDLFFLDVD